jgi:hypothetical protein
MDAESLSSYALLFLPPNAWPATPSTNEVVTRRTFPDGMVAERLAPRGPVLAGDPNDQTITPAVLAVQWAEGIPATWDRS